LEKPRLSDVGNAPLRNISIAVTSPYMGTSSGSVVIGSADIYYGENRKVFFEIESENAGNIFFGAEPIVINAVLENPNRFDNGEAEINLTVKNRMDNSMYSYKTTASAGTSSEFVKRLNLDELSLPFGIYDVYGEIYIAGSLAATAETELSRVSAAANSETSSAEYRNTFVGLNTHAERFEGNTVKELIKLAAKTGVGFIRVTLAWEGMEKNEGEYIIPDNCMTIIEEANKYNLGVMVLLGNRNSPVYPNYKPWRTGSTEENFQKYLEKFSAYVENIVSQLKDKVECWEIYNEYTLDYPGYDASDVEIAGAAAKDYADILKAGYNAVTKADADARVVGGAFAYNGLGDNFAGELYRSHDVKDYMDAVSYHYYSGGTDTSLEIQYLKNYNTGLSDYISEAESDNEIYLDEFNFTTAGILDDEEQALYNVRFLTKERYLGEIDRIYPYVLDSSGYTRGSGLSFIARPEDEYDFLKQPMAATPNYVAFCHMNKLLSSCDNIGFTEDSEGNYIYEFYDNVNERPVYVIWNKTDSDSVTSSVTIQNDALELIAYDIYGNELASDSGSITVTTGKSPVYVTAPKDYFHVGQNDESYKVTLSGVSSRGSNVSVIVLDKDVSEDEFASIGQILYTDQKKSDSEGEWSFTFKITKGNGEYQVLLTEENGERFVYNLTYDAGKLKVKYQLMQAESEISKFSALGDGNLNINYRIDNPENKKTGFNIFGCLYKGDTLVDVVKSPDSQLLETDLIKTGSFTVPDIKKSEIDKVQILILDGTNNLKPLYQKFVLE